MLHSQASNQLGPASLIAAAAVYAAAELLVTLLIGRFFDWGRAEPLLFFAFRPWLALAAALMVARQPWRGRLIFYAAALVLAALSEASLLLSLGASDFEMGILRGMAAGVLLWLMLDIALQTGLRLLGRWGVSAAAALAILLFTLPDGLAPYEAIAIATPEPRQSTTKPELMLMTALPIIWGETGAFDPASRPAQSYLMLQREFRVKPLDMLDRASLRGRGLLLLAQPRALASTELLALDTWVRSGGRALILTDPSLLWPNELPLGDIRRPPAIGLLSPLLDHWGLNLEPLPTAPLVVGALDIGKARRRIALAAPGRFTAEGRECRVAAEAYLARCRLGRGAVILIADADMLRDDLWRGLGENGADHHRRLSDNVLILADYLDELGGVGRERLEPAVAWIRPGVDQGRAAGFALLPLLLALAGALMPAIRRRG